ncbi:unnamed protein product [Bathycoccus prasinos]
MSYREGTIYNLFSPNTNQCYIGCTTKDLKTTFTHLRAYSKRNRGVSSNVIIEAGEAQIKVLETFHDITISALRKELGKVQEKYADVCVNTHRAGRTEKDRYKLNPEKFIDKQKEFYQANRDKVLRKLALKSMKKRGLPCTDRVREKYNITQAEIDDCIRR